MARDGVRLIVMGGLKNFQRFYSMNNKSFMLKNNLFNSEETTKNSDICIFEKENKSTKIILVISVNIFRLSSLSIQTKH